MYNPTMNEAEWVPVCGLANDLSWAEEKSAVALANYVLHAIAEVARTTRLRAGRIVSCPSDDSSTSTEEEEVRHSDTQSTNPPTDTDPEAGDESEDRVGGQTNPGDAVERDWWQHPQNWEAIMEEAEGLAYDDPRSDSNAKVMGADGSQGSGLSLHDEAANSPPNNPRNSALHMPGSPMEHMPPLETTVTGRDTVKVHVDEEELNNLLARDPWVGLT